MRDIVHHTIIGAKEVRDVVTPRVRHGPRRGILPEAAGAIVRGTGGFGATDRQSLGPHPETLAGEVTRSPPEGHAVPTRCRGAPVAQGFEGAVVLRGISGGIAGHMNGGE